MNKAIVDYIARAVHSRHPLPTDKMMRPIVSMPEEDRATDIWQHAQKCGRDPACGSGDILADRQTHRQAYSSQYFATAPAGEVMNSDHVTYWVIGN